VGKGAMNERSLSLTPVDIDAVRDVTCIDCGEEFSYPLYISGTNGVLRVLTPVRCEGCQGRAETQWKMEAQTELQLKVSQLKHRWLTEESGFPEMFADKGFSEFDCGAKPKAYDVAQKYLRLLCQSGIKGAPSLMLASRGNGTGKTHLATAIGYEFIEHTLSQYNPDNPSSLTPVLFSTAMELFLRIRATYNDGSAETEDGIMAELRRVPLLILDDIGKETASEHTRQTYFTILNLRYNCKRPIILTSNLLLTKDLPPLERLMGVASISRIREMTDGWCCDMSGPDYRFGVRGER